MSKRSKLAKIDTQKKRLTRSEKLLMWLGNRIGVQVKKTDTKVPSFVYEPQPTIRKPLFDYVNLFEVATTSWVLRRAFNAKIQEATRNRWIISAKFKHKCSNDKCRKEFNVTPKDEKCDACGSVIELPNQKQYLKAVELIDKPNSDYRMDDLVRSSMFYDCSLDDYYWYVPSRVVPKFDKGKMVFNSKKEAEYENEPTEVYVEDSRFIFPVSDEYGHLGGYQYYCGNCYGKEGRDNPVVDILPDMTKEQKSQLMNCTICGETLLQTSYVQEINGEIVARFTREEIVHGSSSAVKPALFGNCLSKGTMVWTEPNIWKPIEDVNVGELVYSIDRKGVSLFKVKNTLRQEKEVYRVTTDHRSIEASLDHKFKTNAFYGGEWKRLGDLNKGDYITIWSGQPKELQETHFRLSNGEKIDKDFMRFLGFYLAEGSMIEPSDVRVANKDFILRKKYGRLLERYSFKPLKKSDNDLRTASYSLVTLLKELGFEGKSFSKRIPDWIFSISNEMKVAFIEGVLDGDGHKRNERMWGFGFGNVYLAKQLRLLCMSLGWKVTNLYERDRELGTHRQGEFYVYPEIVEQNNLGIKLAENFTFEKIRKIEKVGLVETYDLEVENARSFIAEGILVHNSKIISVWKIVQTVLAMDDYNHEVYSEGKVGSIIGFPGEDQLEVDEKKTAIEAELKKLDGQDIQSGRYKNSKKIRTLFLGLKDGQKPERIPIMENLKDMQSLEFYKVYLDAIGEMYGVTPEFVASSEGKGSKMRIQVDPRATKELQNNFADLWNSDVFPKFGITDWILVFNATEEKDELGEAQTLHTKMAAVLTAVQAGLNVNVSEDGKVTIQGEAKLPNIESGEGSRLNENPRSMQGKPEDWTYGAASRTSGERRDLELMSKSLQQAPYYPTKKTKDTYEELNDLIEDAKKQVSEGKRKSTVIKETMVKAKYILGKNTQSFIDAGNRKASKRVGEDISLSREKIDRLKRYEKEDIEDFNVILVDVLSKKWLKKKQLVKK